MEFEYTFETLAVDRYKDSFFKSKKGKPDNVDFTADLTRLKVASTSDSLKWTNGKDGIGDHGPQLLIVDNPDAKIQSTAQAGYGRLHAHVLLTQYLPKGLAEEKRHITIPGPRIQVNSELNLADIPLKVDVSQSEKQILNLEELVAPILRPKRNVTQGQDVYYLDDSIYNGTFSVTVHLKEHAKVKNALNNNKQVAEINGSNLGPEPDQSDWTVKGIVEYKIHYRR